MVVRGGSLARRWRGSFLGCGDLRGPCLRGFPRSLFTGASERDLAGGSFFRDPCLRGLPRSLFAGVPRGIWLVVLVSEVLVYGVFQEGSGLWFLFPRSLFTGDSERDLACVVAVLVGGLIIGLCRGLDSWVL